MTSAPKRQTYSVASTALHTACGLLLAATLSWGCTPQADTDAAPNNTGVQGQRTLNVGAIPDQDPEKLQRLYGILAEYLSTELGVPVTYQPVTDYTAAVTAFKVGDFDLVWFGGLTGVQARIQVPEAEAIAQRDIKRMVAYSSIGHMGYILLGAAAGNSLSLSGSIAQMVSHGFIVAILFALVGIIEEKVGTRELSALNGLMNPIRGLPVISALLVMGGMASAGMPGLINFAAEFIVFQGSFRQFPVQTLVCVIGTGLTAVYFVILLNRTCFGRLDNETAYFPKVTLNEKVPAYVLAAMIVILGIQPGWLLRWGEPTAVRIIIPTLKAETATPHSEIASLPSTSPPKIAPR
ncbi:MAG: proton-conducting transporter membrane subunit [Cyanobacteria bacterium J06576_12]